MDQKVCHVQRDNSDFLHYIHISSKAESLCSLIFFFSTYAGCSFVCVCVCVCGGGGGGGSGEWGMIFFFFSLSYAV